MMNLTKTENAKHLHNTNQQSYTQKLWMMFYRRLTNAEFITLTTSKEEWNKRLTSVIILQFC